MTNDFFPISSTLFLKSCGSAFECLVDDLANDTIYKGVTVDSLVNGIRDDLWEGKWRKTNLQYKRAGAFVHFLKSKFGTDRIKRWYQSYIRTYASDREENFMHIFGISFDDTVKEFRQVLSEAIRKK